MPFSLRTEAFRDNPRRLAFLNGPLVLCAQVDGEKPLPALVAPLDKVLEGFQPLPDNPDKFAAAPGVIRIPGEKTSAPLTLEPFYQMHGERRYVVYWDVFTPEQWTVREQEYLAELTRAKELEARTVDVVQPGEEQSERDHALKGEKTGAGEFGGRKWRHATGGWFSWDLKVQRDVPQELCVTYWGSDGGSRVFDILVDGVKVATQRLQNNRPGKFYDQAYALPATALAGKDRVTIRFQAQGEGFAGGVFGCRMLRK